MLFSIEIKQQKDESKTVPACIEVRVDDDKNVDELRSVLNILKVSLGALVMT
jgi:hypothetical protein